MRRDSNRPVYFDCSVCGECCSSWNIPVEGEKARALLERDWVRERLASTHRELIKVNEALYRIPLTDENVCVFLGDDRRCLIETNEGLSLKPDECQRFPFAAVRMPDGGMQHDTSAACKKIAEQLILAFQPILPRHDEPSDLERGTGSDTDTAAFPRHVYQGLLKRMSFADYEAWLGAIHPIFQQPDIRMEDALRQARQRLQYGSGRPAARPDKFHFQPWLAQWLLIHFLRKPYGTLSWVDLIRGREYRDPRVFGIPINLKAQAAIGWDSRHDGHVNAYLYNLLSRKVLLSRGASLSGLLGMAGVACLLVHWYARTLAWIRDDQIVALSDVTMAIRLVERYYVGHQPRFLQFFASRWRGGLIGQLLLG